MTTRWGGRDTKSLRIHEHRNDKSGLGIRNAALGLGIGGSLIAHEIGSASLAAVALRCPVGLSTGGTESIPAACRADARDPSGLRALQAAVAMPPVAGSADREDLAAARACGRQEVVARQHCRDPTDGPGCAGTADTAC